jgi:signal transduction histidine kinase
MNSKFEKLKDQLRQALDAPQPDFGRILALSNQLATYDSEFVRFTADSGLISRLGEELVARQETAVSELVKNSYDADARKVTLMFVNALKPGGELVINDDGLGMTREQLIDGFMRLASAEKLNQPTSPRYKRQRAGRKGIGRFAAQRLGTALELTTQTEESSQALRVSIDWKVFESERDLFSIPSRIQMVPKERDEGTTLRISGLREAWSDAEISRVFRYIADLIQPFPISKRNKPRAGSEKDPGFKATFLRTENGGEPQEIASEERMVFDYALAEITGSVDMAGYGEWTLKSTRLGLDEKHDVGPDKEDEKKPFRHLQNVHFRAYYFIWDPSLVPGQQFSRLRNLASQQGGIRLYRNGFRVLPYGEPRNDWLGLDEEYRRRSVLPPIANVNWFGFVQLTDPAGKQFEETSSREGLANNSSYRELVSFVGGALVATALRVANAREKKQTAGQKDFKSQRARNSGDLLDQAATKLEKTAEGLQKSGGIDSAQATASAEAVRTAVDDMRKAKEALLEENAMLRVLSSLGLTIGIFTHEIRHQLFNLKALLSDWADGNKAHPPKLLPTLESKLGILQSYAAYFDAAVSANVRRELEAQDLSKHLFDFIDQFRPVLERSGCGFCEDDIEEDLRTVPMHYSEWASILGNLLTNSIKAIRRSPNKGKGKISIRARKERSLIVVDFSDNGDGIPSKFHERIFEPFFTTSNVFAEHDEDLTGTGLGLKIVRDIITSYDGDIYVTKAPRDYVTCLRIEIPAEKN